MVAYITNPLTGRQIQYRGNTFNRLIAEGYEVIDWVLVQRQTNNPIIQTRIQYYNIETGRIVQEDSRTYQSLLRRGYHSLRDSINEDNYYIIPPDLRHEAELALMETSPDMSLNNLRRMQQSGVIEGYAQWDIEIRRQAEISRRRRSRRLARRVAEHEAELARLDDIDLVNLQDINEDPPLTQLNRDRMMNRLTELNITLCKECQMPYNPSDLVDELCKEC